MFSILIGTMTVFQTRTKPIRASTTIRVIWELTHGIRIPMAMASVTDRLQCSTEQIQFVLADLIHSHLTQPCHSIRMAMVFQTTCQTTMSVTWLRTWTTMVMASVMFLNSIVIQIHWTLHPRQPTIWTAMESVMHKTMTLMAMDYPTQQNKIQLRLLSSTMLILMVTESAMDHLLLQCLLVSALLVLMHSRTIQLLGLIPMVTEGRMKSFLE